MSLRSSLIYILFSFSTSFFYLLCILPLFHSSSSSFSQNLHYPHCSLITFFVSHLLASPPVSTFLPLSPLHLHFSLPLSQSLSLALPFSLSHPLSLSPSICFHLSLSFPLSISYSPQISFSTNIHIFLCYLSIKEKIIGKKKFLQLERQLEHAFLFKLFLNLDLHHTCKFFSPSYLALLLNFLLTSRSRPKPIPRFQQPACCAERFRWNYHIVPITMTTKILTREQGKKYSSWKNTKQRKEQMKKIIKNLK